MRSLRSIQQSLAGKSGLEKKAILSKEVKSLTDAEKAEYRELYEKSQCALRLYNTVANAVTFGLRGYFFYPVSYFPIAYYLTCVATGNPIQEPRRVIKEARKKRRHKRYFRERVLPVERGVVPIKTLSRKEIRIGRILYDSE